MTDGFDTAVNDIDADAPAFTILSLPKPAQTHDDREETSNDQYQ